MRAPRPRSGALGVPAERPRGVRGPAPSKYQPYARARAPSIARLVKTDTIARRYPSLAWRSALTSLRLVPAPFAAFDAVSAVGAWPTNAASTCGSRTALESAPVNPTRSEAPRESAGTPHAHRGGIEVR